MPRHVLRFGPYHPPKFRIGQSVGCLARGEVHIVGISDAPQQWPVGAIKGGKSPVLYGSLVRAVKREQAKDVAKAWGVGASTVNKWRRTLGVEKSTAGYGLRMKAYYRTPAGKRALKAMHATAQDPARREKIAAARRGKPRPRWIIEAMAKARTGMRHTRAAKSKMSAAHKARGTRPPWLNPAWTAREDRLLRTKPPAEVARLAGRSLSAVKNRRRVLKVRR